MKIFKRMQPYSPFTSDLIPTMARFLGKLALFWILLGSLVWLVFFVILAPDYNETFSMAYRKESYLSSTRSPKVILLGGSNALYSIDSGLLEQRLGRPVVNMAIQVGIPPAMQINQIEPYLAPGDLVVMDFEYSYYVIPNGSVSALARLLEVYPKGALYLDPPNQKALPTILKIIFQEKYNRFQKSGKIQIPAMEELLNPADHLPQSMVNLFSPQGDLLAHLDQPARPITTKPFFGIGQLNETIFGIINDIDQRSQRKGASAILTFPSARQSNCAATAETFQQLTRRLKSAVQVPIVGTPESYCFPDDLFFDTEYHLLREGRRIRTEQMATDLKVFIK